MKNKIAICTEHVQTIVLSRFVFPKQYTIASVDKVFPLNKHYESSKDD